MVVRIIQILGLLIVLASRHRGLVFENLALRQQLAVYQRTHPKPTVRWSDRLFWVGLRLAWPGWKACGVRKPELLTLRARIRARAAKTVATSDPDRLPDRLDLDGRLTIRWHQPEASVRSIPVVMIHEDIDHVLKVPRVRDDHASTQNFEARSIPYLSRPADHAARS